MPQVLNRLEFHLPRLLALVTVAEMMVYRLLVPALRPRADIAPPGWHMALTYLGLFLFYFASALALGVIAHQLLQLARGTRVTKQSTSNTLKWFLVPVGVVFLVLTMISIVTLPSSRVTFLLEGSFVLALAVVVVGQLLQKGDLGVRLGLVVLVLPLIVHFYAPVSVRYIGGEEALWNGLTDDVESLGRWLVLFSALTMPYCFGARPFFVRAARIPPLLASLLVGVFGAMLVRHDYLKGMELAQNGLGFSVGPAAPSSLIALCLLGLSAVAWTLTNTLMAPSESRRNIGVGLALVILGGYAFAWPLQYLVGLAGVLSIAGAAKSVQSEETYEIAPSLPSIDEEAWGRFMDSALTSLREESEEKIQGMDKGAVVTASGDAGQSRTHFVYLRNKIAVKVTVERVSGVIVGLDVRCGDGTVNGSPTWSLHSDRPSTLGVVHPSPPHCSGRRLAHEDTEFISLYTVMDKLGWSERLLGTTMRLEIRQRIKGWIAIWPDGTLRFQVYPGRGAPLDSPIPVTALAFQTGHRDPDDLLELLDTLVRLAVVAHDCASGGEKA